MRRGCRNDNTDTCSKLLKKFYSIISQAYLTAITEDGDPTGWDIAQTPEGSANFINHLKPYLKIIKDCATTQARCTSSGYKNFAGANGVTIANTGSYFYHLVLSDGVIIISQPSGDSDCSIVHGTAQELSSVCGFLVFT